MGPHAQVEADIRPFRGLLLGLFFVTTGASLDVGLLLREWEIVVALLLGLIAVKILIIGSIAPFFGLNRRAAWACQGLQAPGVSDGQCASCFENLLPPFITCDSKYRSLIYASVADYQATPQYWVRRAHLHQPSFLPGSALLTTPSYLGLGPPAGHGAFATYPGTQWQPCSYHQCSMLITHISVTTLAL